MNAPSVRESSGQQRGQHMLQWRGNQSLQTKTALSFTTLFLHCKQNLNIRPQRFSPTNLMLVFFMSQSAPSVRSTSPVSIQCPENERLRGMEILQNLGWFHTCTCYKCLEFGIYVVQPQVYFKVTYNLAKVFLNPCCFEGLLKFDILKICAIKFNFKTYFERLLKQFL